MRKALLWSMIICFLGIMIWSFLNIGIVVWRAESIAKGQPYCIQFASQTDMFAYEAPTALFDFNGLKMRARMSNAGGAKDLFFQHHAILIVENQNKKQYLNWSYRQQNFVNEVIDRHLGRTPRIHCIPEQHFALHLPFIFEEKGKKSRVNVGNRSYVVPQAYRPRVGTYGKITPMLCLTMRTPNLEPYTAKQDGISQYNYDVYVRQIEDNYLNGLLQKSYDQPYWTIQAAGEEFNLKKILLRNNRTDYKLQDSIYFNRGNSGVITTLIRCDNEKYPWARGTLPCEHYFVRDNLLYEFRYKKEHLGSWYTMEQRLVDLVKSFEEPLKSQPLEVE